MNMNGIRGIAALILAVCTPINALAQPPEELPDSVQAMPAYGEGISCEQPSASATSQSCGGDSRLARWWRESVKPCLQYSHWGYPEYFEETPFGSSVRATQGAQICAGWGSQLMFYHYDFCEGAASLNLHGQRRLNEMAAAFPVWMHHRLRIEATPGSPQLDMARRDFVAKILNDAGVPAQVTIGYPAEVSPFGDETRIVNDNLLRRVQSGKPLSGSSMGSGSRASSSNSQSQGSQ